DAVGRDGGAHEHGGVAQGARHSFARLAAAAGNDHARTFADEQRGDGGADAARATGNDRNLAVESAHRCTSCFLGAADRFRYRTSITSNVMISSPFEWGGKEFSAARSRCARRWAGQAG